MSHAEQLMILIDLAILVALCADVYISYQNLQLSLAKTGNGGYHV